MPREYTPNDLAASFDLTHASVNLFRRTHETKPTQELSLKDALGLIQGKRYRPRILALRQLLANGDQAGYDTAKAQLAAITFCGTFAPTRAMANLVTHTGVAHGDIDHIDDYLAVRQQLCHDPYTLYLFASPAGNRLKVGARVDTVTDDAHYKHAWQAVADYHLQKYGIPWDTSGKDVSRLCYVSHDPELYLNPDALCLPVPTMVIPPPRQRAATAHTVALSTDERQWHAHRGLQIATEMIRASADGARHITRLKASTLLGGYVEGGVLDSDEALEALKEVVSQNTDHYDKAVKDLRDGLEHGKKTPITLEELETERQRWLETHGRQSRNNPQHTEKLSSQFVRNNARFAHFQSGS